MNKDGRVGINLEIDYERLFIITKIILYLEKVPNKRI